MTSIVKVLLWGEEIGRLAWDSRRKNSYFTYNPQFVGKGIDVSHLMPEHIVELDGRQWIMIRRQKTDVPTIVLLLKVPKMILDKYEGVDTKGRLLPILSNQKMNAYLKEIADLCGIKKTLTFHIARHTFATMTLSKGVPVESISRMLGHTNIRTTQIYAKITNKKIEADMLALTDKLTDLESTAESALL